MPRASMLVLVCCIRVGGRAEGLMQDLVVGSGLCLKDKGKV